MEILLGNFLIAIGQVLDAVMSFYSIVFLLLFIFSWVNPDPSNVFVQFVHGITDPILRRIRSKVKPIGMFDMAFFVAILLLIFVKAFIVVSLIDYGQILKFGH